MLPNIDKYAEKLNFSSIFEGNFKMYKHSEKLLSCFFKKKKTQHALTIVPHNLVSWSFISEKHFLKRWHTMQYIDMPYC